MRCESCNLGSRQRGNAARFEAHATYRPVKIGTRNLLALTAKATPFGVLLSPTEATRRNRAVRFPAIRRPAFTDVSAPEGLRCTRKLIGPQLDGNCESTARRR